MMLSDGTKANCHIQNFSHGGLFLVTADHNADNGILNLPSGTVANIRIPTKGDTKVIRIKTVHTSANGLGVAFAHQENELLDYLQRIAATGNIQKYSDSSDQGQSRMGAREIELINWMHAATKRFLESRYPDFIQSSYNVLFDAGNHADSDQIQSSLFDAYNTWKSHQDPVRRTFLENVRLSFDSLSGGQQPYAEPENQQQQHPEMELVAQEDFEEWVSVVSLTKNLEFEVASKLYQLKNSISYLTKTYISNERNPVSPYSLLWSLKKSALQRN